MKTEESPGKWLWPVIGARVCLGLGSASGLSSLGGDDSWYQDLVKPPGTPPPWIFGPVWSILYVMMGVSVGRLIHRGGRLVVWVFALQFVLNLLWTPVFFGKQEIAVALAIIVAICLGLAATIRMAGKSDRVAAWLLVPYLLWVSYAAYLNAGIFWLNRG